ncbi:MAG: archaetidylserine decarboxylase, partial [Pseudomonadota bacterium]
MTADHFFYDQILSQLPKKWISHALGTAAHWKVPALVNRRLLKAFSKAYKINLEELEKPLKEYRSLGEFFSRSLKEGARPVEGDLVHPCDGVLIESGVVHEDTLIQAKGKSFHLNKFIPENPWYQDFQEGSFFTYYLAPHNYHRVHCPADSKVTWSKLVPGELWPVNSWSVKNVDGLYAVNERVISGLETENGKMILVMVGATNVGRMSLAYDQNIVTNRPGKKEV